MKRILFFIILFCISLSAIAQESCPQVIPALQQWRGTGGTLSLPVRGSIVIRTTDEAALESTARILISDLKELMGWDYTLRTGKPRKNDICLSLTPPDEELGEEGYVLDFSGYACIKAPAVKGVFWGTRSLLQILFNHQGTLPKGIARDYPQFPNRGFMLDVARKFFTMDYLKQYVKILSFYKMNEFQIHLNDNGFPQFFENDWNKTYAAFRLESERFPGLTSKDGSYTKKEFIELQKMGKAYGVNIIPEIDIPAHSLAFAHYKPEIASQEYGMDHLDLYKEETYRFVDTLLDEYLCGDSPVFIGPDVHIGTDEYNKKEAERYRYFTDRYLKYIAKYGKNPRMWGGLKWLPGKTPVQAEGVTVNAWSYDWIDPEASLKDGYKLINSCDTYLYIVPSAGYYRDFLDHQWLYETWSPWLINKKLTLPEAPGVNLLGRIPSGVCQTASGEVQLTPAGEVCVLSGTDSISTVLQEVGYPYAVSFKICPDENASNSSILFKGPHSVVYANWENKGCLAFSRDGYTFVFHSYHLPEGVWSDIRIEGDYKGTSLYVNGKLQERLEGRTKKVYRQQYKRMEYMEYQETLIFPLQQIGDGLNGFKGKIKNVVCKQF